MADLTVSANVDSLLSAADYAAMRILLLQGQSLTGSEATSLLDMTSTWNTTGTPTALKLDVTDTASNASSLLMDLQVGGASKFDVGKDGRIRLNGGDIDFQPGNLEAVFGGGDLYVGGYGLYLDSALTISWASNTSSAKTGIDLYIARDAAGILAQRNSTNAQESRVYNTYTDASNGEWLEMGFQDTANTAVLKTNANGTGTVRALVIGDGNAKVTLDGGAIGVLLDATTTTVGSNVYFGNSNTAIFNSTTFGIRSSTKDFVFQGASSVETVRIDKDTGSFSAIGAIKSGTYTVATLPAAATAGAGATAFVSDGSVVHAGNSGSVVAGSGANFVPVYSDGTDWRIT